MKIHLSDDQEDLPINPENVSAIVEAILSCENRSAEELSISFLSPEEMCKMHLKFFDDPSITDCMSFPIDDEVLGDVVICPKVAIDYGGDPYEETTLYLVHGLLHLIGYNDIDEEERKKMREAEAKCMAHLKSQNLTLIL